ncbi:hypothetical protein SDC9_212208 [bioreactor metagenome]|uniref:Uncharacterized protein n=1 Tax=bioreactor metagenome TaxID=1076179 RepID=A0A645JLY6_9ZZZZ
MGKNRREPFINDFDEGVHPRPGSATDSRAETPSPFQQSKPDKTGHHLVEGFHIDAEFLRQGGGQRQFPCIDSPENAFFQFEENSVLFLFHHSFPEIKPYSNCKIIKIKPYFVQTFLRNPIENLPYSF